MSFTRYPQEPVARLRIFRSFELPTDSDEEINAISVCSAVLSGLQGAGAQRVLEYLLSRHTDPGLRRG